MLRVNYSPVSELHSLKEDWKRLEKGPEMTYFQSFDWYESICNRIPKDCACYEARFAVLSENNVVLIIAPLWIIKKTFRKVNRQGIYLLGRGGWNDYLNFIYSEATHDEICFLLTNVSDHYRPRFK